MTGVPGVLSVQTAVGFLHLRKQHSAATHGIRKLCVRNRSSVFALALKGNMTQGQGNLRSAWQERMAAMRNLPPVLKSSGDRARSVVVFGVVFRLVASVLPLGLLLSAG